MAKAQGALFVARGLALGHAVIDAEHASLTHLWHEAVQSTQIELPLRLARLKKRMTLHFAHELELIEKSGAVMCECHRSEHQTLLSVCDQVAALAAGNLPRARSLLRTKFAKLVRQHIIFTDQMAVLRINRGCAEAVIWQSV